MDFVIDPFESEQNYKNIMVILMRRATKTTQDVLILVRFADWFVFYRHKSLR